MNRQSFGKCLQIISVLLAWGAPIPSIYIICITTKPGRMPPDVLNNYEFYLGFWSRVLLWSWAMAVALFFIGRLIKGSDKMMAAKENKFIGQIFGTSLQSLGALIAISAPIPSLYIIFRSILKNESPDLDFVLLLFLLVVAAVLFVAGTIIKWPFKKSV